MLSPSAVRAAARLRRASARSAFESVRDWIASEHARTTRSAFSRLSIAVAGETPSRHLVSGLGSDCAAGAGTFFGTEPIAKEEMGELLERQKMAMTIEILESTSYRRG